MPITQKQIAERLGVSRQLIGHSLSGHPAVAKATREKIRAVAQELGYCANPLALALAKKRTQILAVWLPAPYSAYYTGVIRALDQRLRATGYEMIVSDLGLESTKVSKFVASHVPADGIFAVDAPWHVAAYLRAVPREHAPCVSLGAYCSEDTDSVRVDLFPATTEAAQHLVDVGYRRIAHLTSVQADHPGEARRSGYSRVVRKAGLKPEFILTADQQRATARRVIQEYVRAHGCPEAIFCHTDEMAIGAYRGLRDLGRGVPEDVALVGCDGIEEAEYLECPLTTIVPPAEEMCAKAWEFLQRRMEKPDGPAQRTVLQASLVIRQSTSPSRVTNNNQKGEVR